MPFLIGKRGQYGSLLVVTKILRGGLSMDNYRTFSDHGIKPEAIGRRWTTREAAQKSLDRLHHVGGFTDFEIVEV